MFFFNSFLFLCFLISFVWYFALCNSFCLSSRCNCFLLLGCLLFRVLLVPMTVLQPFHRFLVLLSLVWPWEALMCTHQNYYVVAMEYVALCLHFRRALSSMVFRQHYSTLFSWGLTSHPLVVTGSMLLTTSIACCSHRTKWKKNWTKWCD